ncbi:hypothetical protein Nepgr_011358 [Nepenthes gracilis]|uniref:Uncharacterized protein n=1 Tax=Nepenthes gracilis TaxID=150966 RepID=A0AAD3SE74_NEPGR|nr:hypothetical protein Nepgr_011358 [Nepenthes gracilis]
MVEVPLPVTILSFLPEGRSEMGVGFQSERGDIDLNSLQRCADTMESLKQTMLNQELVFRTQVYELHQIYRTQKTLMEEFKHKVWDSYNLKKCPQLIPPKNLTKCHIHMKERTFPAAMAANSMHPTNLELLEEQQQNIHCKLRGELHGPIDLRLPADEFISHVDYDFPENRSLWNSFKGLTRAKSSLHVEKVCDLKDIKLSINLSNDKKSGDGNKIFHIPHDVVDLEDPSLSLSNNDACSAFLSPLAASSSSQGTKRDKTDGISMGRSLVDVSPTSPCQASFSSGFNAQQSEALNTDFFFKNQLSASRRAIHLDLNTVQIDISSCSPTNSPVLNSVGGLSVVSQKVDLCFPVDVPLAPSLRNLNTNHFIENSDMHQVNDALNFSLADSEDKSRENLTKDAVKSRRTNSNEIGYIDLKSVSGPSIDADEVTRNLVSEPKNQSFWLQSKTAEIQKLQCCSKSDSNADNQLSSIRTMQSGIECEESHFSTCSKAQRTSLVSQAEESHPGEPEHGSSDGTESNSKYIDKKEQPEADESVRRAAESLIHISLERRVHLQDGLTKATLKGLQNKDDSSPQYSSESYELMALKLTESSHLENSVSSKVLEVSESDNKKRDSGCTLKRGSRMRDFQRDILPGLSTLARHEICEDINIMKSAIRSREYKRMRLKMGDGGNWCKMTRSRRSRTNYKRRYYA